MAKKTKAQLTTDINTDINSLGNQSITGAILNAILIDIIDSVPVLQVERKDNESISSGTSNIVTFDTSFEAGATYSLQIRCYDSLDAPVEFEVIATAIAAFTISCVKNAYIDYTATEV